MNERVRMIRKALGLTLEKFGERIGIKKSSLSSIETGANTLTEQNILFICNAFNVNEKWLRTGEGEMFLPLNREQEIARFTKKLLLEESDSYKNRLISALYHLTDEQWEVLEKLTNDIVNNTLEK